MGRVPLLIKKGISFCFLFWFAKHFNLGDFLVDKPYESIIPRLPLCFMPVLGFAAKWYKEIRMCIHALRTC